MAKLFFVGLDGTEKSYRLQTHRPFTVGRDPGNDIILRDPKVSRHHSEIVFERGFFVIHDLASANGTFVNGKRIRVAPLTHGVQIRMGNTYGRFSEELPTEADGGVTVEPFERRLPEPSPVEDYDLNVEALPTTEHKVANFRTTPHDKVTPEDLKKK
jgi:pSer/pThr/pTyr-binding forkhead associated (FHA) protein